jgi:hypothetical protein
MKRGREKEKGAREVSENISHWNFTFLCPLNR